MNATQIGHDISEHIWKKRYKFGEEKSYQDTCKRVINAVRKHWLDIYSSDVVPSIEECMHMLDFKFLPAGRILTNLGTSHHQSTLINCFVMDTIKDELQEIFRVNAESAMTQKYGGGVGYDFSTLRPKGFPVKGSGGESSGPVSFMHIFNSTCKTITSAGARRGAQIAILRCDHPDIMEFIKAKQNTNALNMFNISVAITDKFMNQLKNNPESMWDLIFEGKVYSSIPIKELWDELMQSAYDYAEPGIIFIDTVNNNNPLQSIETINATNPCGEQPLPPYGACVLGSINLTKFVNDPFTVDAQFNYTAFADAIQFGVMFLDAVVDITKYPILKQQYESVLKRRIGLGITGLADAFVMMGCKYGDEKSQALIKKIMVSMKFHARYASSLIVNYKEKHAIRSGSIDVPSPEAMQYGFKQYPHAESILLDYIQRISVFMHQHEWNITDLHLKDMCTGNEYSFTHWVQQIDDSINIEELKQQAKTYISPLLKRLTPSITSNDNSKNFCQCIYTFPLCSTEYIERFNDLFHEKPGIGGWANSHLLTIAPTGTISLLAGNISSGIEPIFQKELIRTIRTDGDKTSQINLKDWAFAFAESQQVNVDDVFVTVGDLTIGDHLVIQQICQRYIDGAISKTINVPEDTSFEEFKSIYNAAYQADLKGCTTFYLGGKRQGILNTTDDKKEENTSEDKLKLESEDSKPFIRDMVLLGKTIKLKPSNAQHAFYITINFKQINGKYKPVEIFVNTKDLTQISLMSTITRLLSAILRQNEDPSFIIEELQSIYDPNGGFWWDAKYMHSVPAAIGTILQQAITHPLDISPSHTEKETPILTSGVPAVSNDSNSSHSTIPSESLTTSWEQKEDHLICTVCPKCSQKTLYHTQGCVQCSNCDYSKCG